MLTTHPAVLIAPEALADVIDRPDCLVFDCRHDLFDEAAGERAYESGHIPGAFHLHLDRDLSGEIVPGKTGRHPLPDAQAFARKLSLYGLSEGKRVVVYDDKGGGIAARLWWMLRAVGHEAVQVLDGGIQGWKIAGYSVTEGTEPLPATDYRRKTEAYTVADWQLPMITLGDLQVEAAPPLADSRTAARYRGEQEPIDPVAGHIPDAVNYPWPDNLDARGRFKSAEALQERFADLPAGVVFYCGSGVTACHNLLAYALAHGRIAGLYVGGWSEYLLTEQS